MAESKLKATGSAAISASSYHGANGHLQTGSPLRPVNGITHRDALAGGDVQPTNANGLVNTQHGQDATSAQAIRVAQLPTELQQLFRETFPDEIYVPISQLIEREAQLCWADLVRLMQSLRSVKLRDSTEVTDRLRGDPKAPNDTSQENRQKKRMLWDYAENHKRILIKLLVLLQWSEKTEANQATIALNWYLRELRNYFNVANGTLGEQLRQLHQVQDPAPDLETAAEILAAGRKVDLPDLGYRAERKMTVKQMLKTLRRLNHILTVRMNTKEKYELPCALTIWRIHDGRVTFEVKDEFEVSFSVLSEELDSKFSTVDLSFSFRPRPVIPEYLLNEILTVTNNQLWEKGLDGAYRYLHDLTLTQKMEEFAQQAIKLSRGSWHNHLEIEMHKRTLVARYWSQRPGPKSWVEFVIMSGRRDVHGKVIADPVPYIQVRWMRDGKRVVDHDIMVDLAHISFENVINQVAAQHIDFLFDGIYEKLDNLELFKEGGLELEQTSSRLDGHDCQLSIELSKMDRMQLSCDVVSGSVLVSPPSQRASAFQADLSSLRDLVADFPSRYQRFRCGTIQQTLAIAFTAVETLVPVTRRLTHQDVTELFGATTLRVSFMKQKDWSEEWSLAATFGIEGDWWWLVYETNSGQRTLQSMPYGAIHLRPALTSGYFDSIARETRHRIMLQVNDDSARELGIRTDLSEIRRAQSANLKINLADYGKYSSIDDDAVVSATHSASDTSLCLTTKLVSSKEALEQLSAAGLDPSITIDKDNSRLILQLPCKTGNTAMSVFLDKLRYIDDLLSCVKFVLSTKEIRIQNIKLPAVIIDYAATAGTTLSLSLSFETPQTRLSLLPPRRNPQCLISQHLQDLLYREGHSLAENLEFMLQMLVLQLQLLECLQVLQGNMAQAEIPTMKAWDQMESRKWLKMHIMVRTPGRFAIHFVSKNAAFKHDVDTAETPEDMLVRLEIEHNASDHGSKLGYVIRPAIEEFKNYTRPSYASDALKIRLQERVLRASDPRWLSLDNGAKCLYDNPAPLLIAFHDTILEWVKEAVDEFAKEPAATQPDVVQSSDRLQQNGQKLTSQPQNKPQQVQPNTGQKMQSHQQIPQTHGMAHSRAQQMASMQAQQAQMHRQGQIAQSQNFQGRPQMPNMNMSQQHNPSINGNSRVMTAAPQQVRQPLPNAQQRRPNNQQQSRNNPNQNRKPNPQDVINLD